MKIVTRPVRASYVHLAEPHAMAQNAQPKYSVTLLIDKSDKRTKKLLDAAIEEAFEYGKTQKWKGKKPRVYTTTVHDGDEKLAEQTEDGDAPKNPEYEGMWVLTVRSPRRPVVVDGNREPIVDLEEVYSGCMIRASISSFAYGTAAEGGVSFHLNAVQKVGEGDPLGGGGGSADFDDEFADGDEDDDLI